MESIATMATSGALTYSVVHCIFRHVTFEEISVRDSVNELMVHSALVCATYYATIAFQHPSILQALSTISATALIWHTYNKYVSGTKYKTVDLTEKVYIITGSNTGIGFETAKALVAMNATVILACRSLEKADSAKGLILSELKVSPSKVLVLPLDLCDFKSVRNFVDSFKSLGFPLHGLINNAGVMIENRTTTEAGLETVFTANHLSHFLLTNLLLPELGKDIQR
jgi:short chain dehydrogenase